MKKKRTWPDLRKPVKRRTLDKFDHNGRRIVVYLLPGDVIAMREEGRRKLFQAPISRVYRQIATWNVDAERAAKKAEKKAARESRECTRMKRRRR